MKITEVKPYEDRTVILHLRDGEIATAKIAFVDAEYEDIIVDIVRTNRWWLWIGRSPPDHSFAGSH